jgi:uncharacterized protein YbaP (TraB family)
MMNDDEIHIATSLVRRLSAGRFPDWAALPIEALNSAGTDNAIFRPGGLPRSAVDEFDATMLDRRNRMLDAALPLISEGGLFIGVGSAHLPGREGLVELVRQFGYTVTAVE